jgi:hypothetical protein
MHRYELLENLTSVYFGQDADVLFGQTGAEIMAEYNRDSTPGERSALRAEIADFEQTHPALEADFSRLFERGWLPPDFGASAREFLDHVRAALAP